MAKVAPVPADGADGRDGQTGCPLPTLGCTKRLTGLQGGRCRSVHRGLGRVGKRDDGNASVLGAAGRLDSDQADGAQASGRWG